MKAVLTLDSLVSTVYLVAHLGVGGVVPHGRVSANAVGANSVVYEQVRASSVELVSKSEYESKRVKVSRFNEHWQ